jgi:hypothetical protein
MSNKTTHIQVHLHPTLKNPKPGHVGLREIHDVIGQGGTMNLSNMVMAIVIELSDFYYSTGQATVEDVNLQIAIVAERLRGLAGSFKGDGEQ